MAEVNKPELAGAACHTPCEIANLAVVFREVLLRGILDPPHPGGDKLEQRFLRVWFRSEVDAFFWRKAGSHPGDWSAHGISTQLTGAKMVTDMTEFLPRSVLMCSSCVEDSGVWQRPF